MRVLVFSDYHGASELLEKIPLMVSETNSELIVFCGDIVKGYARGSEWLSASADNRPPDRSVPDIAEEAKEDLKLYDEFYTVLGQLALPVFVIPGNMDAPKPRYNTALKAAQKKYENIISIHKSHEELNDIIFTGFGGEITEDKSEDFFVSMFDKKEVISGLLKAPRCIYVTHTPPICHKVDLDKLIHKGNSVVNEVLERMRPIAHFCGHAHNGRGTEKIGNTTIVNPGAFKSGNFAIVDTDAQKKQIQVQFKNCHLMKLE